MQYPTSWHLSPPIDFASIGATARPANTTWASSARGAPVPRAAKSARNPKPAPLLPVLSAAETQPLTIRAMTPVGNYAYGIAFSDGHDTGIFTIDYLRKLGEAVGRMTNPE